MINIFNVRLGHATNSSSSHSMIFLPKDKRKNLRDTRLEGHYYGWDRFTLASKEAKQHYVGAQVYCALVGRLGDPTARIVADALAGSPTSPKSTVDHQSCWNLPKDFNHEGLDVPFAKEFIKYILQEDIIILGGNDNDEEQHPLICAGPNANPGVPVDDYSSCVTRYDEEGDYWSLFNRETGAKVRFSFNHKKAPTRASAPELIDVKITNRCHHHCGFCYQGSTPEGEHAETDNLRTIAYTLGSMKVFECAIGGGEPTEHPHFVQFCKDLRRNGVVPNFTTKSLTWMDNPDTFRQLQDVIGGFAYSVQYPREVLILAGKLEGLRWYAPSYHNARRDFASVQYVMGSQSLRTMEEILTTAASVGLRVTLLGFKKTGRGAEFKPESYKGWVKLITRLNESGKLPTLCIDTALAKQYSKELTDSGIDPILYHTEEGKFSMYIDAVSQKAGESSYVLPAKLVPLKGFYECHIEEAFESWQ